MKLVYGIGINDADYVTRPTVNGKIVWCPFYTKWQNMLLRCYYTKTHSKQPTYADCSVDPRWHSFMAFREWMMKQSWKGRALDKDLLVPGNKIYSPETCLFVPQAINNLFTDSAAARGEFPQGVSWYERDQKFRAEITINGRAKFLGYFPTATEAEAAYRKAKSVHIFNTAHLLEPEEDPRLKPALLNIASTYENA